MARRGENIYKRKDKRWEGRYIKEYINGKAKYGYVYAKTYKEVKEKLNAAKSNCEIQKKSEKIVEQSSTDFKTISNAWLESIKSQLKKSSLVKYSNLLTSYLFPYFENSDIESITIEDLYNFSNELLQSGGKKKQGLSSKTVTSIISVMKNVFAYASKYGNYKVIDIRNFSIKQNQKPMRILSMSEQKILSEYLYKDLSLTNLGILVCLYTGIRIGEICALKWEDISFNEQYLYIHKTMQRIQNKNSEDITKTTILISEPKSEHSIRKIPLPDDLFKLLIELKQPNNTYFLTGASHKFIEPRTMQNHFKKAIINCNIEKANFHALRHTFATRCVELGFDVKSLSEILGHASVNITLNRYVHPSMELKQKNMNMFSNLFAVK